MYRDCNEGVRLSSFLPLFTTPSRFRQHTRAADEHTAAWNSATPPPHPSCIPGAFSVRNGLLHDLFICFWISDARKSYLKACLSYTVTISIVGQNFSCTSWESAKFAKIGSIYGGTSICTGGLAHQNWCFRKSSKFLELFDLAKQFKVASFT